MNVMNGVLALEDGTVLRGSGFGARATACGEAVFNTSMTGYQEILTDPSYKGQIVAMTYPQIGNYGSNTQDVESWRAHAAGFVVRELSTTASNWRSETDLSTYLEQSEIPGVQGLDTRALTKILRVKGAMKSCISTEDITDQEAVDRARHWGGIIGVDFVKEVTHREAFVWDPDDTMSAAWHIARSASGQMRYTAELPPADIPIVAVDYGVKYNILRRLRQQGFRIHVVPATTSAADVLALRPRGVFLSNGPGDPEALDYAVEAVQSLIGKVPIFGICLGNQILGRAYGGSTFKLKFGHRGANQPVKDLTTGKVMITSQNHGFAVDPLTVDQGKVEVSQVNLNDKTVEGMRHKVHPIFSVQYHPEASPGPHDSSYLFQEFRKMILQHEGKPAA